MKKLIIVVIKVVFLTASAEVFAQPIEQMVKVEVAPDHTDWVYKTGENVKFTVMVLQNGNALKNVKVRYEAGPEKMEPVKKETIVLPEGRTIIQGGTLKSAGFLRCMVWAEVEGKEYRGIATAAFDPLAIQPAIDDPADFSKFWDDAKAELAKIPLDAKVTLLPERCTEKTNVYHVNLQNYRNSRVYGILCVPKKEGKYPALLRVPGAGIRPYYGDTLFAEKGFITLETGIHGIPVTMETYVYNNLSAGGLSQYWNMNLDDRDRYYYKRVYLGCVRANDFLTSLPQFDGVNLGVTGGSQGGALSIITAALDDRVKFLGAYYPALSDVTGYLKGRAGGWPHLFDKNNLTFNNKKDKIETAGYYDVVNFARRVKAPGMYSWGFNDEVCPPTSMYAAYNAIKAEKSLYLSLETGHWTYPEQREKMNNWLIEKLNGTK
ncbi:MAG: acetylxylan esterase [Chitinophagaceae bacterium]|nr:acetylxylan esterase [Chitinophagaceae bacterium]